jgi:hypothetical protein
MMIRDWLRNTVPRIFPRRKLIVVAFDLPDRSSHFFNELLGYKHAADALGIGIKIFVPQRADTRLVTTLGATAILDRPPRIGAFDPAHISRQLDSFFDTAQKLDRLWAAIEAEDLSRIRAILFPQPHAAVIRAAGAWLGRHPAHLRPAVFFRFPSGFIKGATARS